MKHRKLVTLVVAVAVIASLLVIGCAPTAPPTGEEHEPVEIVMHSSALGSLGYATATAFEALSLERHPWLRIKCLESGGGGSDVVGLLTIPEWKNSIIQLSFLWEFYAEGKIPGYEIPETIPNVRDKIYDLVSNVHANLWFATLDPNIKTLEDLAGKRVGLGRIGQGAWGGTPTVILKGVFPELGATIDYLGGNRDAVAAMLDGKVNATFVGIASSIDLSIAAPISHLRDLEASGRDYYHISFTEDEVSRILKIAPSLDAQVLPANTIANQPDPILSLGAVVPWGCAKDFPEDLAYEFTKFIIEICGDLPDYVAAEKAVATPELLAGGLKAQYMHPGALKAFREAGVIIE